MIYFCWECGRPINTRRDCKNHGKPNSYIGSVQHMWNHHVYCSEYCCDVSKCKFDKHGDNQSVANYDFTTYWNHVPFLEIKISRKIKKIKLKKRMPKALQLKYTTDITKILNMKLCSGVSGLIIDYLNFK